MVQVLGQKSPFMEGGDGGPSTFQREMERMGLPIVSVKVADMREIRSTYPVVTQRDSVRSLLVFVKHSSSQSSAIILRCVRPVFRSLRDYIGRRLF